MKKKYLEITPWNIWNLENILKSLLRNKCFQSDIICLNLGKYERAAKFTVVIFVIRRLIFSLETV